MSSSGGGSKGNGAVVSGSIPATARKMVQNLKEIVNNCPELEIYAMLKECNMDPSEAVNRLLSQDTFHEVKSKREKKKETKETTESRPRGVSNTSSRSVRGAGTDRGGRISSTQSSSSDYGVTRAKTVHKRDNGANTDTPSSIMGSGLATNCVNRRSTPLSDSVPMESTIQATGIADGISLPSQPSSGFQRNWLGVPGQVSMADIVKMGRPQGKPSSTPVVATETSFTSYNAVMSNTSNHSAKRSPTTDLPSESNQELHSSQDPISKVSDIIYEPGIAVGQHISCDDLSLVDQPPAGNGSIVSETSGASAIYVDPYALSSVDGVNLHLSPHSDDIHVREGNVNDGNLSAEPVRSSSVSDRQKQLDISGGGSCLDDGSLKNSSYQSQGHAFELHEVEDLNVKISSAAANLQQLRLNEELGVSSAGDNPAVIFPDNLQVTNTGCSLLSFGSFRTGMSATASFSGSFPSKPLKSKLEVASVTADSSSIDHSNARNPEHYDKEQLKCTSNEEVAPRTSTSTDDHSTPSASQPEVSRDDTVDATRGLQYSFPSISGYAFPSTTQANAAALTYAQANSQIQNLAPFTSIMHPIASSLPSNLLASTVQPVRELDLPFTPLFATQSVPAKHSTATSSASGPTISLPEAVKLGVMSTPQPTPHSSIPMGAGLPPHLPVHAYSQPSLPLAHFANMIGYPYLPQSCTYMPSAAFQQTYTGNGAFNQSPAAMVHSPGIKFAQPQYKSSVAATSLPQSAVVASGYGGFGNSTNIPGSFTLNPSTNSASTTVGYDEALSLRYKDGNHYIPLQQNENSAMWAHGAGSRTMPALSANTYYSFPGQNQHSGLRQAAQQPSHFGSSGYPEFYHSQAVVPREHQPPNPPSEGNLSGSQGPQSQQSHQMWQHSY